MSPLFVLPPELRLRIYEWCEKEHLAKLAVCNKLLNQEVVPFMWKDIHIHPNNLGLEYSVHEKTVNMKYTRKLAITNRELDSFSCFYPNAMLENLFQNCNRDQLASLKIGPIFRDALHLVSDNFPKLQELHLKHRDDVYYNFLSHFNELKTLRFSVCHITHQHLESLRAPEKLQRLDITHCENLSNKWFVFIKKAKNLKRFKFRCKQLQSSDELAESLSELCSLAHSVLQLPNLDENSVYKVIKNVRCLEIMELIDCKLSDRTLASISKLHNLKELSVSGKRKDMKGVSDAGVSFLTSLTNLTRLELNGCSNLTKDGFIHLLQFEKLTKLSVRGWKFSLEDPMDPIIEIIGQLETLQELDISDNNIEADGWAALGNLKLLRKLQMRVNFMFDDDLKVLPKLKYLEVLDVAWCENLTDASLCHLVKLDRLKMLVCDHHEGQGYTHEGLVATGLANIAYSSDY